MTTLPQRAWVAVLLMLLAGCRMDPKSIEIQLPSAAEDSKSQPTKDKADEPAHHFTQAQVRLAQRTENNEIVRKTLTLDDAEDIEKLLKFFPECGKDAPSELGAGDWAAEVFIELTGPDGSVRKLTTCYGRWNEDNGQGDYAVKDVEGLKKHITELFKGK